MLTHFHVNMLTYPPVLQSMGFHAVGSQPVLGIMSPVSFFNDEHACDTVHILLDTPHIQTRCEPQIKQGRLLILTAKPLHRKETSEFYLSTGCNNGCSIAQVIF